MDTAAKVGGDALPKMKKTLTSPDITNSTMTNALLRLICLLALPAAAMADSSGSDWSSSYGFPGAVKHQTNMSQADLIAKREAGYYDGLGKTQVYNITTTSVGTMTTATTTINGNDNNVAADSVNSGGLDAGVLIQSLKNSSTNKTN